MWQRKFEAPYPDIHASNDSAVIAHGEYLVYGPAHCAECHLDMSNMEKFKAGEKTPLSGGFEFLLPFGKVHSRNLTSDKETGIGKFSDGEIARIIRYQVKPDGRTMIPFMEYQNMSDADLTAIVSYLRSLPPIKKQIPDPEWNFMGKAVLAFLIKPEGPKATPPKSVEPEVTATYGKYLADDVSNCKGCHTERSMKTGEYIGIPFSGGMKVEASTGEKGVYVVTPNITTDKQFGRLANWDEDHFVNRFHQGVLIPQTIMPWASFNHYSDNDLKAIYKYIATIPPVHYDPGPSVLREN
jgi:mono/diheme cytochrome c family protein